jgi:flagellar biosynthesis protein FlhA
LRKTQPSLVGEVVPEVISVGLLQRVLQNLLSEGISIRDLPLILEALGEHGGRTKSAALLTEFARKALARSITDQLKQPDGTVHAMALEPTLEHTLINAVAQTADAIQLNIGPDIANQLTRQVAQVWKTAMENGYEKIALMCDGRVRPGLKTLMGRSISQLAVVAYDEIVSGTQIDSVLTVELPEIGQTAETMLQTMTV